MRQFGHVTEELTVRRNTLDDFYARIRTQDWYHDISDQEEDEEMENQPGIENRSSGKTTTSRSCTTLQNLATMD